MWGRIYQSTTWWHSGARLILYLALCPHHNTYGNAIHRGCLEWPLYLTYQKWPADGAIFHVKEFLAPNTHIMCRTLWNLIFTCFLISAELCGVGHAHFRSNFPFANSNKWKTYFFKLSDLTDFRPTLHEASVDLPDKKRILIEKNTPNIKQQIPAHCVQNRQSFVSSSTTFRLT